MRSAAASGSRVKRRGRAAIWRRRRRARTTCARKRNSFSIGSLQQPASLVVLFYVAVAFFVLVVLGAMMRFAGLGIVRFLAYLRIPTGYSFNLDAFSIYLTLAVVFLAQATNTPLSVGDLLLILGVSLITSKGAHGVPGSAIVILAATLNAVPSIPAIGLVLMLSIDWFVGMARVLGNLIGNCVATVVVAAWEKDLDREQAARVLAGAQVVDVTTDGLAANPAAE